MTAPFYSLQGGSPPAVVVLGDAFVAVMPDNEIPALDAIRLDSYADSMGITRFEALRLALSLLHDECERRKAASVHGSGQ